MALWKVSIIFYWKVLPRDQKEEAERGCPRYCPWTALSWNLGLTLFSEHVKVFGYAKIEITPW